jgi:cullin 3
MLDDNRMDELGLLYTLFVQVPADAGRKALRTGLKADIEERGKGINAGSMATSSASPLAIKTTASGRTSPAMDGVKVKQEPSDVDMNIPQSGVTLHDEKGKGKGKAVPGAAPGQAAQAPALAQAVRWVQDVLDLKDKFDRILEGSFGGDKSIQISINEVSMMSFTISASVADCTGFPVIYQCASARTRVPVVIHR